MTLQQKNVLASILGRSKIEYKRAPFSMAQIVVGPRPSGTTPADDEIHLSADDYIAVGLECMRRRKLAEAFLVLGAAVEKHPDNARVLLRAAQVAARLGRMAQAVIWADRLLRVNPTNAAHQLMFATYCGEVGDWGTAESSARAAVELAPKSSACLARLATILWESGNPRDSEEAALRSIAEHAGELTVCLQAVRSLLEAGSYFNARNALQDTDAAQETSSVRDRASLARLKPIVDRLEYSVVLLGNCNVEGISRCMGILAGNARVARWRLRPRDLSDGAVLSQVISDIERADVVFYQPYIASSPKLREAVEKRKSFSFPAIFFTAFHPDQTRISVGRDSVGGPIGAYNSCLSLLGFKLGLSVKNTVDLFCRDVFERLGYLDLWHPSVEALERDAGETNFEIAGKLREWSKQGCFMHHYNHPKLFVLEDVARALMAMAGLPVRDVVCNDFVADPFLSDEVFPVYPEVAERFGWTGSYHFKAPPDNGLERMYDLKEFIACSFEIFGMRDRESLTAGQLLTDRFRSLAADISGNHLLERRI